MRIKRENWFNDLYLGGKIFVLTIILFVILFSFYLFYRIYINEYQILHLYFLPLLLGLTIEFWRISKNFIVVLFTAIGAFVLSFFNFLPYRREYIYNFEDHLEFWPFVFLAIFIFIAMIIQFKNATLKLTEGITLLQSIAINYWIFSNDYWNSEYLIVKLLIIINLLFSAYSIFHSISYRTHSKLSIFILSLWSSIIILILSFDNILKVYQNKNIADLTSFSESSFAFLQFFFLGISSIYIAQNIIMVVAFLPGKNYLDRAREFADIHLDRYSNKQVYLFDTVLVLIVSLLAFIINYKFQYLPTNFMIWTMITITPFYIFGLKRILR